MRMSRPAQRKIGTIAAVVLVLLLACVPLFTTSSFGLSRFVLVVAYLMAAIGLNLAMGYAGEFVLAHPVIMGISAYATGILGTVAGWPTAAVFPAATVIGVAAGVLIMSPGLRVRGWYYALITMFAVLVLPPTAILAKDWTGGEDGLSGLKSASAFGRSLPDWALFELTLACFVLVWWCVDNFARSGWGHRLRALRDARQAAEASGIDLTETRLVVYVLTSIPAALAGVLLAYSTRFVGIDMFGINLMLLLLTGVVLGGPGTRWGPVLGMAPLLVLSFWVGPFSPYNAVGLGVGLLVGAVIFPDGIMAAFERRLAPESLGGDAGVAAAALPPIQVAGKASAAGAQRDSQPIVEAIGVTKSFGGNRALAGVDFRMQRGALVGLVGPNGSGKSTFLNAVSGFLTCDAGSIRINGAPTTNLPPFRVARSGVGRTFQVPQLIEEFTVVENIEIGLVAGEPRALLGSLFRNRRASLRDGHRRKRALEVFELLALPPGACDLPVSSLPLGLKRVVEVGRAIASNPQLLLLDEPAAGLNDAERSRLADLLRRLQGLGISVLVVEHNVQFMLGVCEELVLLEAGCVTFTVNLSEPMPQRLVDYLNYKPAAAVEQEAA
jgi:branched-chain amino acid transport system permease protein